MCTVLMIWPHFWASGSLENLSPRDLGLRLHLAQTTPPHHPHLNIGEVRPRPVKMFRHLTPNDVVSEPSCPDLNLK